MAKAKFGSRLGLVAATVGSAVGLGNIWRFPAEAQSNGGAAFLLLYIICVCVLGIPLMLAEFSLGRGTRRDAVGAFSQLKPHSAWWGAGALSVLTSYIILCFYMVVAGWTLEYLWQSATGNLYDGILSSSSTAEMNASFRSKMESYVCTDINPLINTLIIIGINIAVLIAGVKKGIERISTWMMPLLFLLLLAFCGIALSLPGASEGLSFFLKPDFSKITPSVVVSALGQAFFSLSLGMGILITYGSYYPRETRLPGTATTVALLDMLVAIMMGFIIFPAIASFGMTDEELRGTTLVFVTFPEIFAHMPFTALWSVMFFLLLFVAALTSTISISEVSIAFIEDHFNKKRLTATLIVMLPLTVLSSVCSLSFGSLDWIRISGMSIFNFLDNITTNYMLPAGAFLVSVFVGWVAPRRFFISEIARTPDHPSVVERTIVARCRWVVPVLILIVLAA